ncbi:hypothetical protein FRB91_011418 [Serendipita sp. 411]|nr:hypothetical protein FRC18_011224 [Serendipita sp. 400]KAG8847785.1 hypothetical protein FRB91_011418 [Serendipita sp. 411]
MYTATGAISTLPGPTPTPTQTGNGNSAATPTVEFGNGWANPDDTTLMAVPVSGCTYPNPWNAVSAAIPACGVLAKREPAPTAAPAPAL